MSTYDAAMMVIASAKLNIIVSTMNLLGSCLLIYGAFQLRKANKLLLDAYGPRP